VDPLVNIGFMIGFRFLRDMVGMDVVLSWVGRSGLVELMMKGKLYAV